MKMTLFAIVFVAAVERSDAPGSSWSVPVPTGPTVTMLPLAAGVLLAPIIRDDPSWTSTPPVNVLAPPNCRTPPPFSTIEPGADSGDYSHDGAEAGVVVAGTLDLWIGGQHFRLEEGDSFAFSSSSVHRCSNPGKDAAKVIWVITPPHY